MISEFVEKNGNIVEYDDKLFTVCGHNSNKYLSYVGPQNIKPVIPYGLVSCEAMFEGCEELIEAPDIPDTVQNCNYMFTDCYKLRKAPSIPYGVMACRYMFDNCRELRLPPNLPASVVDCECMFRKCTGLQELPGIPLSVQNCKNMFYKCLINPFTLSNETEEAIKRKFQERGIILTRFYEYLLRYKTAVPVTMNTDGMTDDEVALSLINIYFKHNPLNPHCLPEEWIAEVRAEIDRFALPSSYLLDFLQNIDRYHNGDITSLTLKGLRNAISEYLLRILNRKVIVK